MESGPLVTPDNSDESGIQRRCGGIQKGSKHARTLAKIKYQELSRLAAESRKRKKEERAEIHRQIHGIPRRSTGFDHCNLPKLQSYPPLSEPQLKRPNRILSDDEIRLSIRLIISLHNEWLESHENTHSSHIFEKAAFILDLSQSKLYELWEIWCNSCELPKSAMTINAPRSSQTSQIVKDFSGEIRTFIIKRKLEGKVVEVPDIQKFLKDVSFQCQ